MGRSIEPEQFQQNHSHLSLDESTPKERLKSYAIQEINEWEGIVAPEYDCLVRRAEVVQLFGAAFDISPGQFEQLNFADLINREFYVASFGSLRYAERVTASTRRYFKSRILALIVSIKRGEDRPEDRLPVSLRETQERNGSLRTYSLD